MSTIARIMTQELHTVAPTASIQEAAQKMKTHSVGSLPVTVNSRLAGIITDRDIAVRVIAKGRDPQSTLVRDAMTTGVVVIHPEKRLEEAEALMKLHQIRRLPVVDGAGRLVGYITMATIAKAEEDEKAVGGTLKGVFQTRKRDSQRFAPEPQAGGGG